MKHTLNISPAIAARQQELLQDVRNKQRIFLNLQWTNNKSTRVYAKEEKLLDDVLALQHNHTKFHKTSYEIKTLKVLEKTIRNPHIKVYD